MIIFLLIVIVCALLAPDATLDIIVGLFQLFLFLGVIAIALLIITAIASA